MLLCKTCFDCHEVYINAKGEETVECALFGALAAKTVEDEGCDSYDNEPSEE